jgi:hypothetical protein
MRLFRFLTVFLAFAVLAHGQAVRPFSGRWEDLRNRPADLVNTAALNVAIAPLVSTSALNVALAPLASTAALNAAVAPLVSTSALNAALASYQPLDADLTAIAALSTTAFARAILEDPNAAAVRARIGAGTGMSNFSGAWADLTGRPTTVAASGIADAVSTSALNTALASYATTAALSGLQPLNATLTTISGAGITGTGSVARNVAPTFATSLTSTGPLIVTSTTATSSRTTGAVTIAGGLGVAGNIQTTNVIATGTQSAGSFECSGAGAFYWFTGGVIRAVIRAQVGGSVTLLDAAETSFGRLQLGGTTTAFPALGRSGTSVTVVDGTGGSGANLSIGNTPSTGGGSAVLFIQNATAVPSSNPSNGGIIFVEGGALKYRGSAGTVTTIANP